MTKIQCPWGSCRHNLDWECTRDTVTLLNIILDEYEEELDDRERLICKNYATGKGVFDDEDDEAEWYYFRGHDWTENGSREAFIAYPNLTELAEEHYEGNLEAAVLDTQYVFTKKEYNEWLRNF